jgi:hypothetical protein
MKVVVKEPIPTEDLVEMYSGAMVEMYTITFGYLQKMLVLNEV